MKLLFRILKSPFTDKLAYVSAVAGTLCWVIHARYPALFPGSWKASAHIYAAVFASLAGGLLIAKYVFTEGYRRTIQELHAEKDGLAGIIQRLEGDILEIREERDRISERESVIRNRLKSFENSEMASQQSSLRKKNRSHEEDKRTALTFLLHELRSRLQELDTIDDRDIVHAAAVLKKELHLLENEIKKGEMSLYELVLTINEIREHAYDLTLIRLQSGGEQEESVRDHRQPRDFPWFDAETDPSLIDRRYKFLKVAFHPDRFPSEWLKEEAKIHFQEAAQAYSALKERLRATTH